LLHSVIPLDSFCLKADAGKDTAITLGDSVFIGSYTNGIDSLKWQIQNTNIPIDSIRPGFWVHPTVTTSYILQQVVNGCFSADTVVVSVGTVPLKFTAYRLQLTENGGQFTSNGGVRGGLVGNIWQTANEVNVSHFNILRSVDGINFKIIGSVKAQNKSLNNYSFIHENVNEGLNYYKIGSIDFDGKMGFSEVRTINLKPQTLNSVSIYPNPAKEHVVITCNNAKELMIIDYLGRVVYSDKMHRESYNINLQSFSNGLYLVKLITNDNLEKVEKLIKQ
jgi:hypothetical protein